MASVEELLLFVGLSHLDGAVKLCIDLLRHHGDSLVEVFLPVVFVEVECCEGFACLLELVANLGHSLHVGFKLDAELLAEDVYKLDGGSGRSAGKPPYVGVDDVYALDDGGEHGCQAVAGGAVSVEIHGHFQRRFELRHEVEDA